MFIKETKVFLHNMNLRERQYMCSGADYITLTAPAAGELWQTLRRLL